jgi:nicotinate-nucleotide adenylyltransferase
MRLGIFGGTFDPVHLGHLLLAENCRETCGLERVVFVPCARSPHKQDRQPTSGAARLEMLRLAIGGNDDFEASDLELQRGGISYSVDTVAAIRQANDDTELYFLLGADSLAQFHLWKQPERICELATLLVIMRPGTEKPRIATELFARLPDGGLRMMNCAAPLIDISSSDIRARVAAGKSIRYRTPRAVEEYIRANRLYRNS